jgi:hypothetical protein
MLRRPTTTLTAPTHVSTPEASRHQAPLRPPAGRASPPSRPSPPRLAALPMRCGSSPRSSRNPLILKDFQSLTPPGRPLALFLALLGLGDSFKSTVRKHHPADLARWLNSNASLRVFTPSARHATIAAKARGRSVGHAQGRQGKAPTSQASAQGQSATARMKAFFRPTAIRANRGSGHKLNVATFRLAPRGWIQVDRAERSSRLDANTLRRN